MALRFPDRVAETSVTTGTTDFELAGPVGDYRAFSDVLSDGDSVHYSAFFEAEVETGIGTYNESTGRLERTDVKQSSNNNNKVSFSTGTKTIIATPIGDMINPGVETKSADYTVTVGDYGKLFLVDSSGGDVTLDLPSAADAGAGFSIDIKKTDSANAIVIDGDGSEEIDGATSRVLRSIGESCTIVCDGATWHVVSETGLALLDNKLINPLGKVNQHGYSSGAATSGANQYTLDRWRVVTSGQSLSWTESAGVRTMTAPAGGVEQVIEGASILSGDHVLFWDGTATATVNGVSRAKGEVFALTGGSDVTVRFSSGTFAKPKLELGHTPTRFDPRDLTHEYALCQWYYRRFGIGCIVWAATSTTIRFALTFSTMRATPSVSLLDANPNVLLGNATVAATGAALSSVVVANGGLRGVMSGFTGLTPNVPGALFASETIELDAEI